MRVVFTIFVCIAVCNACKKNVADDRPAVATPAEAKHFTYLALGDSYTIGQGVSFQENFPNQVLTLLTRDNVLGSLKISAKTGWTTSDLSSAIEQDTSLRAKFDVVSLLIGVNNQYQGVPIESYGPAFEHLLKKAIAFAGSNSQSVIVLSIPDWGVTPFANGRDRAAIAHEIDAYNDINKAISVRYGVHYIDITPWTREAATDLSLLEPSGLHPSGKEYARWAVEVQRIIKQILH